MGWFKRKAMHPGMVKCVWCGGKGRTSTTYDVPNMSWNGSEVAQYGTNKYTDKRDCTECRGVGWVTPR